MSTTPWDEMARRWREVYDEQASVAKQWMDGQAQLGSAFAGATNDDGRDPASDAEGMAQLWRSWTSLGSQIPGMGDPGTAYRALASMIDPAGPTLVGSDHVRNTFSRLTDGPQFADIGNSERRAAQVMEQYFQVQAASRAYEVVVAQAWVEANQLFSTEVATRVTKGEPPLSPPAALRRWLDIANEVLMTSQRSPAFLDAQRTLLRETTTFLLAQREHVELLLEPAGLPTRSELDEVHHSIQILKRRVRALERTNAHRPDASEGTP